MPIKPAAAPAAPPAPVDPVQTVNSVDPASPTVVVQVPVVATLGPPGDVTTSVTEGGVTTVVQPSASVLPTVDGLAFVNHGADAHFQVLHGYVGKHRQGSLIKLSDLPGAANIVQLIKLGALKVLPAFGAFARPAVITELEALGLPIPLAVAVESEGETLLDKLNPKAGATALTSGGQA